MCKYKENMSKINRKKKLKLKADLKACPVE
jgi:hypothetical protein